MDREEKEKQVIQDFQETFTTEHGLRSLERIAKFCKEETETYVKGDTHETAPNEGRRSVILLIRRQLKRNFRELKQKRS